MQHFHQRQQQLLPLDESCPLCTGQNFAVMLNRALYDRYLANVNLYYTDSINDFIEQQITTQTSKFRQQMCDYYDQQLLKRQYGMHQYNGKIQMLSQYYKFHRDIPKIFEKSVFRTLGKYFDRLRHYDYKKIKCVLKQQQGISLTTQKSDQSSVYSDQIKKSKYSTVLYQLDQNSQSQSQILHNFCEKVDKAFQHVKFKNDFKGQYYSGQKKFQQFLLNTKKVHPNKPSKLQFTGANQKLKNYNLLHKPLTYQQLNSFSLKTDRAESKKKSLKKKNNEIIIQPNNALKQSLKNFKKIKNKNSKSIQKTTANQTISRDEKSKRMQKLQKTLQLQIQKNQNNIFKPFATGLIGLKNNAMLKTLQQIYQPSSVHQKYHSDKSNKTSQQQSVHNLQKIYQNKLSGRKSQSKIKSKPVSQQNSKQVFSNLQNKQPIMLDSNQRYQKDAQTQRPSLKRNQLPSKKSLSQKKLLRSKSTSKTLHTNIKSSNKLLQTIDYLQKSEKRPRSKSIQHKPQIDNFNHRFSHLTKQKDNILSSQVNKPLNKQQKQRNSSRKDLSSTNKKQRSSSKKSLNSTKKIERSGSKSHVNSARGVNPDKIKFQTIDPEANKNIQKYLQRKLTIVQQPKVSKAKFYN